VCTTEGEIDIVTEVSPADAARVEHSEHARLVSVDAVRAIAGVINRDASAVPLGDRRARQALNLAVDRDALVREVMFGRARALAGLTPPAGILRLDRVLHPFASSSSPYAHDPDRAAELWRDAGAGPGLPLRIAAPDELERVAARVAAELREALGVAAEVTIHRGTEAKLDLRRRLADKARPPEWDVLIWEQGAQAADAVAVEMHRAFVGATGEWRAGPIVPTFEALYAALARETSRLKQAELSHRIDKLVYDEALALFLCAPEALYAVNRHVDFTPYRTTFELAECRAGEEHWSRR
jgi:peptide/nickel transport system substrate-binding protein